MNGWQWIPILLVTITTSVYSATEPADVIRGYRVLHTSPQEFNSALFTPAAYRNRLGKAAKENPPASRLEKYYRVKSKRIDGKVVTLEILPEVPLLGSAFGESNIVKLRAELIDEKLGTYFYNVEFFAKAQIMTTMQVSSHPSGSLITLTVINSTMGKITSAIFYKTIFSLGFLSEKPVATF
jgi:hypothetical protein